MRYYLACITVLLAIAASGLTGCGSSTSTTGSGASVSTTSSLETAANESLWLGTWSLRVNEGAISPASTGILSGTLFISASSSRTARSTFTSVRTLVWDSVTCVWGGSHLVDDLEKEYTEDVTSFECTPPLASVDSTISNSGVYSFSADKSVLTAGTNDNKWVWDRM